jgi:hypothetical protein
MPTINEQIPGSFAGPGIEHESVIIDNRPVLIDNDGHLETWLESYLRDATLDPFFVPNHSFCGSLSGSDESNNFYFESALPKLPNIRLGCIQWPAVGASRFARGLFAVDSFSLAQILLTAWGIVWNPIANPDPPVWVPTKNDPVEVQIVPSTNPLVRLIVKFFVLPPIRVSNECWLVRLVDLRYFKQSQTGPITEASLPTVDKAGSEVPVVGKLNVYTGPYLGSPPEVVEGGAYATGVRTPGSHRINKIKNFIEVDDEWEEVTRDPDYAIRPTRTWLELCADLRVLGIDLAYVPDSAIEASLGVPDILYANANAPLLEMADSIAYSVCCRPVVQLRENADSPLSLKLQCQRVATAAAIRTDLLALAKITGGDRNTATSPKSIEFITPAPWSYYRGEQRTNTKINILEGRGPSLECKSTMHFHWQLDLDFAHDKWDPQGIYNAYHNAIALTLSASNGWNRAEHSICLPGIQEVVFSGHDDYLEFDWSRIGPTTRVVSLPVTFFPKGLLAQHPVVDPDFEATGTTEDEYPPCPWYSTPHSHVFGAITEASPSGEYLTTKRAWSRNFANVQLVDDALAVKDLTTGKFRKSIVKALICIDTSLSFKESVKLYFGDQLVWNTTTNKVEPYRGWIIYGAKGGLRFARYTLQQSMQLPTQDTNAQIYPLNGTGTLPETVVRDTNSIAQWQANGDAGVAVWDGTRWSVIFPWCVSP